MIRTEAKYQLTVAPAGTGTLEQRVTAIEDALGAILLSSRYGEDPIFRAFAALRKKRIEEHAASDNEAIDWPADTAVHEFECASRLPGGECSCPVGAPRRLAERILDQE